ncbi:MAG: acylneuraminate cytidylyltransferase family protein [Patescibacteria group bacterium]
MRKEVLAITPARSGSKRIPNKNIRDFLGKPLIAYTIEQGLACPIIDRYMVDTNSPEIAKIAKKYGAEVPFLRPAHLAQDGSLYIYSLFHVLKKLKKDEGYVPTHVMILQTTSPLREMKDIMDCWEMYENTDATTVLTVCPTHPKLYHLSPKNDMILVNGQEGRSNDTQKLKPAYLQNGCFVYIINTEALLKEKLILTKKTKAVVCPKWRSVDLDSPEEWVMAELLYKNKNKIKASIKKINKKKAVRK